MSARVARSPSPNLPKSTSSMDSASTSSRPFRGAGLESGSAPEAHRWTTVDATKFCSRFLATHTAQDHISRQGNILSSRSQARKVVSAAMSSARCKSQTRRRSQASSDVRNLSTQGNPSPACSATSGVPLTGMREMLTRRPQVTSPGGKSGGHRTSTKHEGSFPMRYPRRGLSLEAGA